MYITIINTLNIINRWNHICTSDDQFVLQVDMLLFQGYYFDYFPTYTFA